MPSESDDSDHGLHSSDLPEFQRVASKKADHEQRVYQRGMLAELIFLAIAAAAELGTFKISGINLQLFTLKVSGLDAAETLAIVMFFAAIIVRVYRLVNRPDISWYECRGISEAVKSLAWAYAVGGHPFSIAHPPEEGAEQRLADLLYKIMDEARPQRLPPPGPKEVQITSKMSNLRLMSLPERKSAFLKGRVLNQQVWYTRKAEGFQRRSNRWNIGLFAIEVLGVLLALGKVFGILPFDLLGLAGTIIAGGTTWVQAKQYSALSLSYSTTSRQLSTLASLIEPPLTTDGASQPSDEEMEERWMRYVDRVEALLAEEHREWRTAHQQYGRWTV